MAGNFENVGYAAPGKAGVYNVLIMEEKQSIVACGAGASTKHILGTAKSRWHTRIERAERMSRMWHSISQGLMR